MRPSTPPIPSRTTAVVAAVLCGAWLLSLTADAGESADHKRCSSCHFGEIAASLSTVGKSAEVGQRCGTCHGDIRRSEMSHDRGASPGISGGAQSAHSDCGTCHSPHVNGRDFQLKPPPAGAVGAKHAALDEPTRLCLSCHPVHADTRGPRGHFTRHPVGMPLSDGRRIAAQRLGLPLIDAADTADPRDDLLSCITCHQMHGAAGAFRLRYRAEAESTVCRACHAIDRDALLARR